MPKRTDLKKILVIGSGPIVIGQAAEFDYAGTQACLALREEGYEVVLANSNPATIMTDTTVADKVYMEPLTVEYLAKILRFERPDAIVPGIGGQTGLNLAMELQRQGILEECGVELLGTSYESIRRAEDRELFKALCEELGEPVVPSGITHTADEAAQTAALLAENPQAVGLLPQPFVTAALLQNETLEAVLDMGKEWTAAQELMREGTGNPMVTGVTVVRKAFLEEHPEAVEEFVREHQASAEAILEDPAAGAALAVEAGILAKEAVAEKAIPECGITCMTGQEMQDALSAYLEVLAEFDSQLIGGKLPADDFYFHL